MTTALARAATFGNPDQPPEGAVNATNPEALTIPGPHDAGLAGTMPTFLDPPATDVGSMPQFWASFNIAPRRIQDGGWARQVTPADFPISTDIAGVNMRLSAGGIRELHWHQQAEWAVMTYGHCRVTTFDARGPPLCGGREGGRSLVFPGRPAAFAARSRSRWRRVRACLRQWRLVGVQHAAGRPTGWRTRRLRFWRRILACQPRLSRTFRYSTAGSSRARCRGRWPRCRLPLQARPARPTYPFIFRSPTCAQNKRESRRIRCRSPTATNFHVSTTIAAATGHGEARRHARTCTGTRMPMNGNTTSRAPAG